MPPRPAPTRAKAAAGAPPELPLVGRAEALAALMDAHAGARPDGGLAVIEGEAGIGKTRLANELARHARAAGAVVLAARCHDDEAGLPYGPVVELLREAVRNAERGGWPDALPAQRLADASLLLPELAELRKDVPDPLPLDGPGAQVRLLEGVAAVISAACEGPEPGVVFLDDVHAADEATVDAISYLGRRLRGRALLLVIAWRSEAVPPGHRLRRLAVDLVREGRAAIVSPARLDEDEVATLVRGGTPERCGARPRAARICRERGPAAVRRRVPRGSARGRRPGRGAAADGGAERPRRATGGTRRRGAAGARRRGGHRPLLRPGHACGRRADEATRKPSSALEELVAQGVVREVPGPEPIYDFSHQKLRALVYEQTSLARRRLLHGRAAAALSRRRPGEESAALVAPHLRLAGDHAGAAERYRLAAEHAASLHAHADALEHFEAALALGDPDAGGLHERIGDLRTLLGDYGGALASYESAAAQSEPSALAAIEHKLGDVHHRRGEWERAEARFLAALDAAPAEERGLRARIQADLALTLHHAGRPERATTLAREALALAETAADRRAQAQAHNMLGVLARNAGEPQPALVQLERSLALAQELRDDPAQAAALNNLALVKRDAGELSEALALTESALALCAAYGDRHREAALENNLADLHHAAGDDDEAMIHLKRAVAIFTEVGADEATRLPEIWKLVSW